MLRETHWQQWLFLAQFGVAGYFIFGAYWRRWKKDREERRKNAADWEEIRIMAEQQLAEDERNSKG